MNVDYTPSQTQALLRTAQIKRTRSGRHEVLIDDQWMRLCRTDLKDNVATIWYDEYDMTLEEIRSLYIGRVKYGARILRDGKLIGFAVIDSFSDG